MKSTTRDSVGGGGFTLIEILMVLAILAILSMLMVPRIQTLFKEENLNAATGDVVAALEYAGTLAAVHQRPFGLRTSAGSSVFSVFDVRYRNEAGARTTAKPPVTSYGVVLHPVDRTWYTRDLATYGAVIATVSPGGEVIFYPSGSSSAISHLLVVRCGTDTRSVNVNGITGNTSVQ